MDTTSSLIVIHSRLAERRREADTERLARFVIRGGTAVSRVGIMAPRYPAIPLRDDARLASRS